MSSFSTVHLVAWIFFICVETSPSNIDSRELTNQQIELHSKSQEEFPDILPVFLKSPDRILKFNFIKKEVNYNLPVYTRTKDAKNVLLDTPPITNAAFYEDDRYDASVTLRCEEIDPLSNMANSCKERLMSGFFYLDGYKHVIEPKEGIIKRFVKDINPNPQKEFIQRHQVFKIPKQNYSCGVTDDIKPFKNILNSTVITANDRINGTKTHYTIEVLALITHKMPMNPEEIKNQKIYYMHVFWGVNALFNNIDLNDMSFGVDLIGFILEPNDTPLYVFPNGQKSLGYLSALGTLQAIAKFKTKYKHPCDHLTMFSTYDISKETSVIGLANVGAMCTTVSVTLCRILRSFEEIHVVAHEIGHSLDSYHDGENNACRGSDGYIMAAWTGGSSTKQQILNGYKFSECSTNAMKSFVSTHNQDCLLSTSKPPIVPAMPTGQLYPPNEQCKTSSRSTGICPSVYTQNNYNICLSLLCRLDGNNCKSVVPAYKTTCGNKKWCIYGECVYDVTAPAADENCLFGDDENPPINLEYPNGGLYRLKDCHEIIKRKPHLCTVTSQRVHCCHTCNKHEKSSSSSLLTSLLSSWSWLSTITMATTATSTSWL